MQVFIKRFWGFGSDWPIVSFSLAGSLRSLLARSRPGDLMAFVGTTDDPTAPHHRGRLLGLAEFGRDQVPSEGALSPKMLAAAPRGANGDVKWPHAVYMTRAWRFTDDPLPLMKLVVGRQLTMAATSNAVLLSDAEAARVLALPRHEIDVAATKAILDERARIAEAVGPGGTMGPIPASFITQMIRDPFAKATTYGCRFGRRDVWKIGWAHDPDARLDELNKHVPSEILDNQCWHGGFRQEFATAIQAYEMEQAVLASFAHVSRFGERIHATEEELRQVWTKSGRS